MSIGEVLGSSWKIFWKHKVLWLFGAIPNAFYGLVFIPFAVLYFVVMDTNPGGFLQPQAWMLIALFACMFFFLFGYLVMLVFGKAANLSGILQVEKGEAVLSFAGLLREGSRYFWRMAGLYGLFMTALLAGYLFVFGIITLAAFFTMGLAVVCILPFFIVLMPVLAVGYCLVEQSGAALIGGDLGVMAGIKRGWQVLRKNFWQVVLMGLILYGITYLFSMITATPLYLILFVPWTAAMLMNDLDAMLTSAGIMMVLTAVLVPLYMAVSGIVYTYIRSAWMVTYLRLSRAMPVEAQAETEPAQGG